MSDTTGWKRSPHCNHIDKTIGDFKFRIHRHSKSYSIYINEAYIGIRPTLRDCQRLAHATARLWEGDK